MPNYILVHINDIPDIDGDPQNARVYRVNASDENAAVQQLAARVRPSDPVRVFGAAQAAFTRHTVTPATSYNDVVG